MKKLTLLLLSCGALPALSALACPPENENLMIREFHAEEMYSPAYIDTQKSEVVRNRNSSFLASVAINGETICDITVRGRACDDVVKLKNGPLRDEDEVRIVIEDLNPDNPMRKDYVFVRSAPARDQRDLCRPIFPK
jgi:hypothetical protein